MSTLGISLNVTHGETRGHRISKEWRAWAQMRDRTQRSTHKSYADYGGRGIRVCERWDISYEAFLADVGRAPSAAHSLDRINVNGNYEPGNVRWATRTEQARNRRRNRLFVLNGRMVTAVELCSELNIVRRKTMNRLDRDGWSLFCALMTP